MIWRAVKELVCAMLGNDRQREGRIMQTPIMNFVKNYTNQKGSRFHMPGHKGQAFLGCESFDITEIAGADALYEAEGIIAESEKMLRNYLGRGGRFFRQKVPVSVFEPCSIWH